MKAAGFIITGFLFAFLIFAIAPKTQAASSGVVIATVQIRQPAHPTTVARSTPSPAETVFASLIIIPQLVASTSSLPALPIKITISFKSNQRVLGCA